MTENERDELWDEILFLNERQAQIALLAVADGKGLQAGLKMAERTRPGSGGKAWQDRQGEGYGRKPYKHQKSGTAYGC